MKGERNEESARAFESFESRLGAMPPSSYYMYHILYNKIFSRTAVQSYSGGAVRLNRRQRSSQ